MKRSQIPSVFTMETARFYETFYTTEYGARVDKVEKSLIRDLIGKAYPDSVRAGTSLLEIGCGTGVWTSFFQSIGFTVTALEPSSAMLDIAREKRIPNTVFLQREAENLPFPDESFEAVAAIAVLEFVEDPNRVRDEILRVLKPGGWFFAGLLNRDSELGKRQEEDPIIRHGRLFTLPEIESYLRSFSQVEIRGCVFLTDRWDLMDGTPLESHWKPAFYGVRAQKQTNEGLNPSLRTNRRSAP